MRGRSNRTPSKKQILLDAIAGGLTVAEAARLAGCSRRSVFDWKAADPLFARDYEAAYASGTDVYEAEARRRAFTESDTLLIFLLKARDPRRFNQKMVSIGGDLDNPLVVNHQGDSGVVHFYMPPNNRDVPEQNDEEPDDQHAAGPLVTIEGKAEDAGEDPGATEAEAA